MAKGGPASTSAWLMLVRRWMKGRKLAVRVDHAGEGVQHLVAAEPDGSDLDDLVVLAVKARGLEVQGHKGLMEG